MRCPALRLEHTTRHCDKKAQEPGRGGSTWPRSAPFFSWTTSTSRRSFRTNAPTPTCGSLAGVGASRASAQRRRRSAERAHGEHLVRGVGRQLVQVCGEPVRAHHVGRLRVVEHKAGRYRRLQECRLLDGHAQPDAALAALAPRLRRCGPLTPRPGRKAGAAACRVSADRLVQAWRACSEWCRRSVNSSLLSGRQPASTNTPSYASALPARTATAGRGAASAMLAFDTSLLGCNVW